MACPISVMSAAVDLPAVCPRGPGFWSNWPEVWDADLSNDDRFSGRSNFPGSDILLPPYYENYTAGVCQQNKGSGHTKRN